LNFYKYGLKYIKVGKVGFTNEKNKEGKSWLELVEVNWGRLKCKKIKIILKEIGKSKNGLKLKRVEVFCQHWLKLIEVSWIRFKLVEVGWST